MAHEQVWRVLYGARTYRVGFTVDDDECVSLDEQVLAEILARGGFIREV